MTIRKSTSSLTVAEQNDYTSAVTQLNAGAHPTRLGNLVAIHGDMSHNMHRMMAGDTGQLRFLYWHRRYLLEFEAALKSVNANAFIPYWNWAVDRAIPPFIAGFLPQVFVPAAGGNPAATYQVQRDPGHQASLPTVSQIQALITHKYSYRRFAGLLETAHDNVHEWVGGTMSNIPPAPADPLFWMHHAQVDRIFDLWLARSGNAGLTTGLTGADTIMDPWSDHLSNLKSSAALGYSYA